MRNIPKLDASYWMLMLLCTTMGELIGNLLSRNFELGYAQGALLDVCVYSATIFTFLIFKFKGDIFYWILILIGNIGGTNLADWVTLEPLASDKKWGVLKPLELGTKLGSLAVFSSLACILLARYVVVKRRGEKGIPIQIFYWVAILLSSTFGTTSGDFITNDTPFGAFGGSLLLFMALVALYIAFKRGWLKESSAYWSALVLMHPIGATIGNYVSKPIAFNFGNIYTNLVLIILFVTIYLKKAGTFKRRAPSGGSPLFTN